MAKKPDRPELTAEYLHSLLEYDPDSGHLRWKTRPEDAFQSVRIARSWNAKNAGKPAFVVRGKHGHLYGGIWGRKFLAHRIIFKMITGRDPVGIDHINGDPSDNRWVNLREATQAVNAKNSALPRHNTSGHVGVSWLASRGKWIADIKVGGRPHRLGYFQTRDAAVSARKAAEVRFGFHPNHGRQPHG